MTAPTTSATTHDGDMLRRAVGRSQLKPTALARRMGVAHSTLWWYLRSPSLHTDILRRASLALGYNFFHELGMQLPADLPSALDTALTRRVAELERENECLRIENETYQKILAR